MSPQSFNDFLEKLQQDTGLQQELKARFGELDQGIPAKALLDFAAEKGYQYQVAETTGELSDQQLEAVAGGAYYKMETQLLKSQFNWKFDTSYKIMPWKL